ncbi:30S ribosomal protein S19 [Candidatus Woesearchaeota archaeon]|nr:30S ribosomal protein S19 [Candidatus Woesearchaeota archaeon]
MAKKEFTYKGLGLEQLKELSTNQFADILPSRQRRSLKRGLTDTQKKLFEKIKKKDVVKTHCRDMIVFPNMVGKVIRIHNGKEFVSITVIEEMIGKYFGELVFTRKRSTHSAPGVGATKSSASSSVK